jgi:phosphate:Na+ symporter
MHSIWALAAGIVVFLIGLQYMENVLRKSVGRSFKLFLRKHTSGKGKAVLGGAVITAILQGSTTVNMMVLAFTGAGVLPLENALAIVLGSNLGTTLDSWFIATVGFSSFTASLPYVITAMAGIGMYIVKEDTRWKAFFRFFIGLGLFFMGLDLMKTSMANVVQSEWLVHLSSYPLWVYLLTGVVVTAIIQSSFAMMALVLSVLYSGGLDFTFAAALVLGAEVGTTLKFFVASLDGHPVKKRLALGNFLINAVTACIVFLFLTPLARFLRYESGLNNDLLALVAFQSAVNLVSLFIFFPFLKKFALGLERLYVTRKEDTLYIQKIPPSDMEAALPALENEARHFLSHIVSFTLNSFGKSDTAISAFISGNGFRGRGLSEQYAFIKRLHGDIHQYYLQLRISFGDSADVERVDQLMSSVRNGMYAAKNMKDAHDDIVALSNSSNDFKYDYFVKSKERTIAFCHRMLTLLSEADGKEMDDLRALYDGIVNGYTEELAKLYRMSVPSSLTDAELSTIVNFNRELYTGYKSMLLAWKDLLLEKSAAEQFDELPGFIR